MSNINKTYRRDKNHNYLILSLSEDQEEPQYQIEMIRENRIEGLLPCEVVSVNGRHEYRYEITSRQQMDRVFEKKDLTGEDIGQFLEGFKTVLNEIEKYLLDADALIIRPEYIYMDVEKKVPVFCCLPSYKGNFKEEFREFSQYLLKKLDHRDVTAVSMGYNIYRLTLDENYDMSAIFNLQYQQENGYREQRSAENREQDNKSAVRFGEKAADRNLLSSEIELEQDYADEDESELIGTDHNKEKFNKKSESVWKNQNIKNGSDIRNGRFRKKHKDKSTSGPECKKSSIEEREKKTGFNIFKILIVLAGTGVTGGFLLLAAWYGELNLTQLGGLLFLILGLLIYFTSVWTGPKKKEKKKEYTENTGYELMMEYEESKGLTAEPEKKEFQEYTGKRKHIVANKTGELSEKGNNSRENRSDDIFEEYSERQEDADDFFGETVLLNERAGEGFSYCLIPQNTDDRHEIWLTQKNMTVGKLGQQVDIVVDHPSVSRVHARLVKEGENYTLADLNSTNGTYLNGQRLSPDEKCSLKDGDEVRFAVRSFLLERRSV